MAHDLSNSPEAKEAVKKLPTGISANAFVAILLLLVFAIANIIPRLLAVPYPLEVQIFLRYTHMFMGKLTALLMIIHLIMNRKRIAAIAGFAKASKLEKFQMCAMVVTLISLCIAVITGIRWFNESWLASTPLRVAHLVSAWFATLSAGLHVGFQSNKFSAFLTSRRNIAVQKS
jgi:hypothetical protein